MHSKLRALVEIICFYVTVPIIGILAFISAESTQNIAMTISAIAYASLSLFLWFRKVEYDSKTLNAIKIKEAPIQITQLLSETTNKGVLINQFILKTIAENNGISQKGVYTELPIPEAMCPTEEMVRIYTVKLRDHGLVQDMAGAVGEGKKRVYVLTKRGEWCIEAIKKYYPRYYIKFLIRVILRTHLRKKLPSFISIKE